MFIRDLRESKRVSGLTQSTLGGSFWPEPEYSGRQGLERHSPGDRTEEGKCQRNYHSRGSKCFVYPSTEIQEILAKERREEDARNKEETC